MKDTTTRPDFSGFFSVETDAELINYRGGHEYPEYIAIPWDDDGR